MQWLKNCDFKGTDILSKKARVFVYCMKNNMRCIFVDVAPPPLQYCVLQASIWPVRMKDTSFVSFEMLLVVDASNV